MRWTRLIGPVAIVAAVLSIVLVPMPLRSQQACLIAGAIGGTLTWFDNGWGYAAAMLIIAASPEIAEMGGPRLYPHAWQPYLIVGGVTHFFTLLPLVSAWCRRRMPAHTRSVSRQS